MDIDEGVVSRWLEHMQLRNLRHWTIYNRQQTLRRLHRWAGGPVLYLSEADLNRWHKDRARQIQPEPLRTEISHLRQFYRWCQRENFRPDDPTLRIEMPRVHRRLPRPIRDAKLAEAMLAADPENAAILALAAFAGLRAHEIAQLDWSEVGERDSSPHIRVIDGKGGRGRRVPLSTALIAVLGELKTHRGPVIPRRDGQAGPNTASRISQRANKHLHKLGIDETLHQCRHRFASTTYQACRDIRAVQDLLGHASPTTTSIYAEASSAVAISAVEAAGQLAA